MIPKATWTRIAAELNHETEEHAPLKSALAELWGGKPNARPLVMKILCVIRACDGGETRCGTLAAEMEALLGPGGRETP